MKIRTKRRLLGAMESVALTDIILNIFIFFFISFSLLYTYDPNRQAKIPVNLPKAETSEADKEGPLEVTVRPDGAVFVGDKRVELDAVKPEVEAVLAKTPGRVVLLRADEKVDYGRVIQVLDGARAAGAERLGLAASLRKP